MNSKTVRILTPGLALGAALLAGAILAAERPADMTGAPEMVRVRLVSVMAKWRGCLLRAAESRCAEGLGPLSQDHGSLSWAAGRDAAAVALLFLGILSAPASTGRPGFSPVPAGRACPSFAPCGRNR